MIQCEVVTHDGYGVPPDVFGIFFQVVAGTLRETLGEQWPSAMHLAWQSMLKQMMWYAEHPSQTLEAAVA